jgi:hypothetical protein
MELLRLHEAAKLAGVSYPTLSKFTWPFSQRELQREPRGACKLDKIRSEIGQQ